VKRFTFDLSVPVGEDGMVRMTGDLDLVVMRKEQAELVFGLVQSMVSWARDTAQPYVDA
jgi:hypothetical protein